MIGDNEFPTRGRRRRVKRPAPRVELETIACPYDPIEEDEVYATDVPRQRKLNADES